MDKNDLKSMWHDAHKSNQEIIFDKVSIEKSITMNHSKAISKILSDVKLKILVYTLVLAIYIGLMLYALVYLGLSLSVNSLVPLSLAGLFLLINTTSEIKRLLVLTKTADNMPVKESLLFFRKKLNRIRTIDFLSYLIFLYLSAILIIFNYISDIGGVKNLSWSNEILPLPLLGFLILILLFIPWFIKYQHNQRYKKIYSNLNDSARLLNIES
ncbi:MAG: hypothetical protein WCG82_04790 [Bacteroidota bacterium]